MTRITQLAKLISDNSALVEEYLQANEKPEVSLDAGAPRKPETNGDAEMSRMKVIAAAEELRDLMAGPAALLRFDWTEHMSLRLISRLKLAEMVPVGGEVTFAEVAAQAGLPERDIRRIMRHAMTRHVFKEPRAGFVAHTAMSQLLAEDSKQRDTLTTITDIFWPAALYATDAVQKWPGSQEPNQTGFSLSIGADKTMWQDFAENKEKGRHFGVFIGEGGADKPLLTMVDWRGQVVDVGGSHGDVMVDVLNRHAAVSSAVVQDLPETVANGQGRAPDHLKHRLSFQAHDFFKPQPVHGADIYFLRWICHNWSNKYSVQILQNLVPALKPGARVIVNDILLPEPNTLPRPLEKAIRSIDMTMLHLLNASERDADGWNALFKEADERFKVKSIRTTPPGIMCIVEVEWQP